jgi:thiamine-phosphate pyrophosphorylase
MYRIAVTNRKLCPGDFFERIRQLAEGIRYDVILLREKDLSESEYEILAKEVQYICSRTGKTLFLHRHFSAAERLCPQGIHLPLSVLTELSASERQKLKKKVEKTGTSIHSEEQLHQALELGVDYVFAGHIFQTDCKKGVPPRGLPFLKKICEESTVPVYAIGGICEKNEKSAVEQGAAGVCIMSGSMRGAC